MKVSQFQVHKTWSASVERIWYVQRPSDHRVGAWLCSRNRSSQRTGRGEEGIAQNPDLIYHWLCGHTGQVILGPFSRETKAK